jgi:hypothetical protein
MNTNQAQVTAALKMVSDRHPNWALHMVSEVRQVAGLSKEAFDTACLELSKAGKIVLHHHDFPSSLGERLVELVEDKKWGVYYVGVALAK